MVDMATYRNRKQKMLEEHGKRKNETATCKDLETESIIKLVIQNVASFQNTSSSFILKTRLNSLSRVLDISLRALAARSIKPEPKDVLALQGHLLAISRILKLLEVPGFKNTSFPSILIKVCALGQLFEIKSYYDKVTEGLGRGLNRIAGLNIRLDSLKRKMHEDDLRDAELIFDTLLEFTNVQPNVLGDDVSKCIDELQRKLRGLKKDGKEARTLHKLGEIAPQIRLVSQQISFNIGIGNTHVKRRDLSILNTDSDLSKGTWGKFDVVVSNIAWNRKFSISKRSNIRSELRSWYEHFGNGKYIQRLYGYCHDGPVVNVVIESFQKRLSDFIDTENKHKVFDSEVICAISEGILHGLLAFHMKGMAHENICPQNVFLGGESRSMVKIGGFEIVGNCMPRIYIAPEILRKKGKPTPKISFSSDAYSFSLVLWQMTQQFRYVPFADILPDDLIQKICKEGVRPEFSQEFIVETWIKNVVTSSWKQAPWNRPTVSQLLSVLDLHKPRSNPRADHIIRFFLQGTRTCSKRLSKTTQDCLGSLVEHLRDHCDDAAFSQNVLNAMKAKFDQSNIVESYSVLVEHNALPLFIDLLRLHSGNIGIHKLALFLFRCTVNGHSKLGVPIDEETTENGLDAIGSSMQDYREHEDIFMGTVTSLDALAQLLDAKSYSLIDDRISKALIEGLREHKNNARIRKMVFGIIALVTLHSQQNHTGDINMRRIKDVCKLMKEYQKEKKFQINALEALRDLAIMSKPFCIAFLDMTHLVEDVVNIINRYQNSADALERGFEFISQLCSTQNGQIWNEKFALFEAILGGMREHLGNSVIQANGCNSLSNLEICADAEKEGKMLKAGVLEVLFAAFSRHSNSAHVSESAIRAFGSFFRGSDSSRAILLDKDLLSLFIARMYLHKTNTGVTAASFETFTFIWLESDMLKQQAVKQNIVAIVASALREHEEDGGVQSQACAVLSSLALSGSDDFHNKFMSEDMADLLCDAIKYHSDNYHVLLNACRCVSNICLSAEKNRTLKRYLSDSELLRYLLKAMNGSRSGYKLQEIAAWGLWGLFTNCKSNCTAEEISATVFVLAMAIKNHPKRAKVNQAVYWVLSCVCMNFPKARELTFNSELPSLAVQSLGQFHANEHVAAPVLWFLRHLLGETDIQYATTLMEAGIVEPVLLTMRKNRKLIQIQEPALYLLGSLATSFSSDNVDVRLNAATVQKIITMHMKHPTVGLAGAYYLSKVTGSIRDELLKSNIDNTLEKAVKQHCGNRAFCLRVFEALSNMGTPDTCVRATELIVSLMTYFEKDSVIQEKGIYALNFLIRSCVEELGIEAAGTFIATAALNAMTNHDKDLKVQENAAELVWLLVSMFDSSTFQYLVEGGILNLLTKAMKRFSNANKLQYNCCRVLGELCKKESSIGHDVIVGGTLDCLLFSIANKKNNRLCQEAACSAISNMVLNGSKQDKDMLMKKNVKTILIKTRETPVLNADTGKEIDEAIKQLSTWSEYIFGR